MLREHRIGARALTKRARKETQETAVSRVYVWCYESYNSTTFSAYRGGRRAPMTLLRFFAAKFFLVQATLCAEIVRPQQLLQSEQRQSLPEAKTRRNRQSLTRRQQR